jgi:uncharacterized membrane protein
MSASAVALLLTVFVACAVEAVEALTIVLAVGLTRQWRSTLQGMAAALVVLAVVVAVIGPAITLVPLAALRLVVGALLAVFGLQWLRKSVLRASGHKDLHDEAAIFDREVAAARDASAGGRRGITDWRSRACCWRAWRLSSSPSPSVTTRTTWASPHSPRGRR